MRAACVGVRMGLLRVLKKMIICSSDEDVSRQTNF
ncbi:MAG: hypothetical protein JWQ50_3396 [Caballeronia mineralivorans]|jgi:hypothetical protein|nr:hypothetical protein [Caballeronia mineralivorans]MEA3097911.1 hypothetical protein [Caballeronia mineralivorans]